MPISLNVDFFKYNQLSIFDMEEIFKIISIQINEGAELQLVNPMSKLV